MKSGEVLAALETFGVVDRVEEFFLKLTSQSTVWRRLIH